MKKRMRYGAIDIGSNSIRLLVAEFPEPGGGGKASTVARAGEPCRLGRGLGDSGVVEEEIAERAIGIAREFATRARGLGVANLVIGATAALRRAGNGLEVAGRIGEACGEDVRILSGEEEARLVYRSVILGLGRVARNSSCVVFDIGGGSTEVVSGLGPQPGRWTSLPFGAVSLTEKHFRSNPVEPAEMDLLRQDVSDSIMQQCAYMPAQAPVFAGVGGTVTVLAMLDRGLRTYDPGQLEGWGIPAERLEELTQRIVSTTQEERRRWPAMGKGRADIVVAGALAVSLLARRFPSSVLVCSTQGLRYGLARLAAAERPARPSTGASRAGGGKRAAGET